MPASIQYATRVARVPTRRRVLLARTQCTVANARGHDRRMRAHNHTTNSHTRYVVKQKIPLIDSLLNVHPHLSWTAPTKLASVLKCSLPVVELLDIVGSQFVNQLLFDLSLADKGPH